MNMKKPTKSRISLGAAALLAVSPSHAALVYGSSGLTVTENFNDDNFSSQSSNSVVTFANDSTVPNWHAAGASLLATNNLKYAFAGGSSDTNIIYGFKFDSDGNTNSPAGSLGMRTSTSGSPIHLGWALTNNTGGTLTSFDLSYTAFVARGGSTPGTPLTLAYKLGGLFTDSGYTDLAGGSTTLNSGGGIGNGTAGNPAGDVQNLSASDVPFSWENGQTLWLRWTAGTAGNDSIGIDSISFAAVPEPSSAATLLGSLCLLMLRRSRR